MNISPEISGLLYDILKGEHKRTSLARWLAQNSLRFYESSNQPDSMIVAELDTVLADIQSGKASDNSLMETARQLCGELNLIMPDEPIIVNLEGSHTDQLEQRTGTSNSGGPAPQVIFASA